MPKRTNNFQRLVVLINGCLEKGAKVSESALLQDKITDEPREVDILIETHTPGYPVTIAIEVIDRNRRAGTPWVEQMHKKHEALDTHMLVLGCLKVASEAQFSCPGFGPYLHLATQYLGTLSGCSA